MEYEFKVSYTCYYTVEADGEELAQEQVKQLVAEEFNGKMSDEAKYEVI
jgi:hypothetical protein